jgi:hypothetical protein
LRLSMSWSIIVTCRCNTSGFCLLICDAEPPDFIEEGRLAGLSHSRCCRRGKRIPLTVLDWVRSFGITLKSRTVAVLGEVESTDVLLGREQGSLSSRFALSYSVLDLLPLDQGVTVTTPTKTVCRVVPYISVQEAVSSTNDRYAADPDRRRRLRQKMASYYQLSNDQISS